MKKILLKACLISLAASMLVLQAAFAHHQGMHGMKGMHGMCGETRELPSLLHLTTAQMAHFQAYSKDMCDAMMKDHKNAMDTVQKSFTTQQWAQFGKDMEKNMKEHMRAHMGMTDSDVKAMVDKESTSLLLTADQASVFYQAAIKFHHQRNELLKEFVSRLNNVLKKPQQEKLAAWASKH